MRHLGNTGLLDEPSCVDSREERRFANGSAVGEHIGSLPRRGTPARGCRVLRRALCWVVLGVVLSLLASGAQGQSGVTGPSSEELAALGSHFVVIKVHFKRNEEEVRSGSPFDIFDEEDSSSEMYKSFLKARQPLRAVGVVIEAGLVLTSDLLLDEEYVDRFEVEDWAGNLSPAERSAILTHAPGLLLRIEEPGRLDAKPVVFAEMAAPVTADSTLFELHMRQTANSRLLRAVPVPCAVRMPTGGRPETVILAAPGQFSQMNCTSDGTAMAYSVFHQLDDTANTFSSPTLILNGDKQPVGVALRGELPVDKGEPPLWQGGDLLADERVSFPALLDMEKTVQERFSSVLREIKISFRQEVEDEDTSFFGISLDMDSMPWMEGNEVPKEAYYYGLPVAPRLLFVPKRIPREHVKRIETIRVRGDARTLEGVFAGVFQDIACFLVSLEEDLPTPAVPLAFDTALEGFTPLFSVKAVHQFGGVKVRTGYTRPSEVVRGYRDVPEWTLLGHQSPGTFYTNMSGAVVATLVEQRLDDEEAEALASDEVSFLDSASFVRVYEVGELQDHFAHPEQRIDRTIIALSEEEEHRRLWLGVEFEPITEELAKSLGVLEPTKDGTIGLLVSAVYPQSPAHEMGLGGGDILLKLEKKDSGRPIELQAGGDNPLGFDFSDFQLPPGLDTFGFGMPAKKRWKSRDNVLTKLIEVIGEGEEVELTYLAGGDKRATRTFVTAVAPPDFDSAAKMKDEELGLTVKEMTYEVRHALHVRGDANPLVVAKVEDGEPAGVAKIREYDLITEIDDTPIAGLDDFKRVVETARQTREREGKVTLRFALRSMGKTRIADITLE